MKTAHKDRYLLRKPNSMNKIACTLVKQMQAILGIVRNRFVIHWIFFNPLNTENSRSESGWISKCQINVF